MGRRNDRHGMHHGDEKMQNAAATATWRKQMPRLTSSYLSHDLVTEILSWLPVKSLLRFRSVCKAWRGTISGDPSFALAHHRRRSQRQPPSLLILTIPGDDDMDYYEDEEENYVSKKKTTNPIKGRRCPFYRWSPRAAGEESTASLVYAVDTLPEPEHCRAPHDVLAHCDGLVLVPARREARLLNTAARQVVTLPWSPGGDAPHQAYGLGRESYTYKAARFFYRTVYVVATRGRDIIPEMEVITIGVDAHWRETAAQPPYPVIPGRTATFLQDEGSGYLLWTVDERYLSPGASAPGYLRFSLKDETFHVTPAPPCHPRLDYAKSSLTELSGELCVARMRDKHVLELWMSKSAVHPRWEQRHAIHVTCPGPEHPRPVAMFDDGIVFHEMASRVITATVLSAATISEPGSGRISSSSTE
ncbi:hypothetical protein QOZ80_3BG0286140 [Eleusine coracana subsp. coracana]|nr:hypothetical protein QOZ80_3BG0286140 [Eleusine coracana subsp. coracana]